MFTDSQVLHARRVLESFLSNVPGSEWGDNKEAVANAIAQTGAILFLLNDESEYENPNLLELFDLGVKGQDLLSIEVFPEGTDEYMNSSERDATYEEILHFVHVFGIQIALPAMQAYIENAMEDALQGNYYFLLGTFQKRIMMRNILQLAWKVILVYGAIIRMVMGLAGW